MGYPSREQAAVVSPCAPGTVPQDWLEAVMRRHVGTLPRTRVELGPLNLAQAEELLGEGFEAAEVSALYEDSGGNPFYLEQLARALKPTAGPASDAADPEDSEQAVELFHRLVEITGAEVEEPSLAAEQLSFELAGRFEFAPELKQRLLQLTSERERMHLLAELLAGAATAVEREREIAQRAQGNGKVDPRN